MQNSKLIKGYFFAILSAVIYGSMPLMAKHIYADGVNSISLVFFRNFLALPVMAFLAYRQSKTLKVFKKALPSISIIAVLGCCVTPLLLFSSYNFIPSSTSTVFHFIYPAVVILFGILFMKQRVDFKNLLCVIICVFGICFFYTPGVSLDWRGSVLALVSGITYAIYVCLLSNFKYKQISGFLFSFYVALINSFVLFAVCIITNSLTIPKSLTGWLLCFLFAILITTGAVVLFQAGTFIIGGERASILSTLEPITSIFLGVLFLGEKITLATVFGTALVILASVLIAVFDIRKSKNN